MGEGHFESPCFFERVGVDCPPALGDGGEVEVHRFVEVDVGRERLERLACGTGERFEGLGLAAVETGFEWGWGRACAVGEATRF